MTLPLSTLTPLSRLVHVGEHEAGSLVQLALGVGAAPLCWGHVRELVVGGRVGKEGLLLLLLLLGVRACRVRRNTLNDRVAVHCYLKHGKHSDMKMDACTAVISHPTSCAGRLCIKNTNHVCPLINIPQVNIGHACGYAHTCIIQGPSVASVA